MALQVPPAYLSYIVVDERTVAAAHRRGLAVHVWTIDEPAEMARLVDLGVDGIISDRPSVLGDVLRRRGVTWPGAGRREPGGAQGPGRAGAGAGGRAGAGGAQGPDGRGSRAGRTEPGRGPGHERSAAPIGLAAVVGLLAWARTLAFLVRFDMAADA